MADRQKVILMSKLAVYDKYYSGGDKRKAEFFQHDYVYRQNLATRFFTLLGSLIVILFYFMHRIIVGGLDILDLTGEVMNDLITAVIFAVLVQVFYSLLGYLRHSDEYNKAQERIDDYFENMNKLSHRQYVLERRKEARREANKDWDARSYTKTKEEPYRRDRYEYDDREYPED